MRLRCDGCGIEYAADYDGAVSDGYSDPGCPGCNRFRVYVHLGDALSRERGFASRLEAPLHARDAIVAAEARRAALERPQGRAVVVVEEEATGWEKTYAREPEAWEIAEAAREEDS